MQHDIGEDVLDRIDETDWKRRYEIPEINYKEHSSRIVRRGRS